MDGFYAEVRLFAGTFAPVNWAFCDGSLLRIREHSALFYLLGTRFGGDGQETFALPDLRGRVVIGVGQGAGPSAYTLGQPAGTDQVPTQPVQGSTGSGPSATVNSVVPASGNNVQPVLGLNYIICVEGAFPPPN